VELDLEFSRTAFTLDTFEDAKVLLARLAFWVANKKLLPDQAVVIDRLVTSQVRVLKMLEKKKEAPQGSVQEEPLKLSEEDRKIAEASEITDPRVVRSWKLCKRPEKRPLSEDELAALGEKQRLDLLERLKPNLSKQAEG